MGSSPFSFEPLREQHLPFLLEVRNECRSFLHDDRPFTLKESRRWLQHDKPEFWLIQYEGAWIGYFRFSDRDTERHSIRVGADLHPRFRGRGLARRAYEEYLSVLKHRDHMSIATLEVLSHNLAAQHLYRRLGFLEVGRRRAVAVRDGSPVDSIVMEKTL
jgi:RimJ/RimL family protein N-acetyltransferase